MSSSSTREFNGLNGRQRMWFLLLLLSFSLPLMIVERASAEPAVNAGGPAIGSVWTADTAALPSPHVNAAATTNRVSSTTSSISFDSSVPSGTPMSVFQTDRWDPAGKASMQWDFPVLPGQYLVRLYFAENYAPLFVTGGRVFNVSIEGQAVLPNFDIYAEAGAGNRGIVETFLVNSGTNLDVDFGHVTQNPLINAIEVIPASAPVTPALIASPSSLALGSVDTGDTETQSVTLTNSAAAGGADLTVNSTSITGADAAQFSDSYSDSDLVLSPGESSTVDVTFAPTSTGAKSASLAVQHTGSNAPLTIPLSGTGTTAPPATPALNVSPSSVALGSVDTGDVDSQPVTLTNGAAAGGSNLTVNSTSITGADAAHFSDSYSDNSVVLAPGQSTTLNVTFAPSSTGAKSASLVVQHSGSNSPSTIALSGTGTTPATSSGTFVNAGGPAISGSPAWAADTAASPSPYVNAVETTNRVSSTTSSISFDPSVPSGTPMSVFQTNRWDPAGKAAMQWNVPTTAGESYQVRLYFAESYAPLFVAGGRVFDVSIDGAVRLNDYDIYADVGGNRGVVKTFTITSDGNTDIDFGHVTQNPLINAIEIVPADGTPAASLSANRTSVPFGTVNNGQTKIEQVVLTANGGPVTVTGTTLSGANPDDFTDSFDDGGQVTLQTGESLTLNVTFHPTTTGAKEANLQISHDGSNTPLAVALSGTGQSPGGGGSQIGFGRSTLQGESSTKPTSLGFGPDGRLYAAQINGMIYAYTVERSGPNNYQVTATEQINNIRDIVNHDDDGSVNPAIKSRMITGIHLAGTAAAPVIYATSSDPRIGVYGGEIPDLDTNSSMISKITKNGSSWVRQDLVRGLPRSKENHSANGLVLDPSTNDLYMAISGNTNAGGPSTAFGYLPEFAMGNGILKVDLDQIGSGTYDLPTLDDEDRSGTNDANDPFGGNYGKNQAVYQSSGPVTFFVKGLRNPYKVIIGSNGELYTIDNGGNAGWGGVPDGEGAQGTCTNNVVTAGDTVQDKLFKLEQGQYLGHPNPTRGNIANTFNETNPQSPVAASNPIECDFLTANEAGALTTFADSANGFVEYTASNFNGALQGDFLVPLYNGNSISRLDMNAAGTAVNSNSTLFNAAGVRPLDIATQNDDGTFHGDLFVADVGGDQIIVYEPNDFDGEQTECTGVDSAAIDEDNDGYTNADEIDNGSDPCSSADAPSDHDVDGVSDLNDTDDDNDEVEDVNDAFAIDPENGLQNSVPTVLTFDNDQTAAGLLGLNFTGLMTNGTTDWLDQFDGTSMTAGGAGGLVTVDEVPEGDALESGNDQSYAFQVGVNPGTSNQWTAQTRALAPFAGTPLADSMSQGIYIGTGDQDNYIKLVVDANGGSGGVSVLREIGGVVTDETTELVSTTGVDHFDLFLTYNPALGTVQAAYQRTIGGTAGTRTNVGPPLGVPSSWLTNPSKGLATGIIATSAGPPPPYAASWDFLRVVAGDGSP